MRTGVLIAIGCAVTIAYAGLIAASSNKPVLVTAPAKVVANDAPSDDTLKAAWGEQNDACRGGVDPASAAKACPKRDQLEARLQDKGWCWAYSDDRVIPVDYDWHRCSVARPAGWKPEPEAAPQTAIIPDETVTRAQFNQLQINMFRDQVTKIMGTPGVNQSTQGGLGMDQLDTVTWGNPDGSQMILTFRNGLLASKTQFRLP